MAAGVLTGPQENELRMVLYGLYVLVKLHFHKKRRRTSRSSTNG